MLKILKVLFVVIQIKILLYQGVSLALLGFFWQEGKLKLVSSFPSEIPLSWHGQVLSYRTAWFTNFFLKRWTAWLQTSETLDLVVLSTALVVFVGVLITLFRICRPRANVGWLGWWWQFVSNFAVTPVVYFTYSWWYNVYSNSKLLSWIFFSVHRTENLVEQHRLLLAEYTAEMERLGHVSAQTQKLFQLRSQQIRGYLEAHPRLPPEQLHKIAQEVAAHDHHEHLQQLQPDWHKYIIPAAIGVVVCAVVGLVVWYFWGGNGGDGGNPPTPPDSPDLPPLLPIHQRPVSEIVEQFRLPEVASLPPPVSAQSVPTPEPLLELGRRFEAETTRALEQIEDLALRYERGELTPRSGDLYGPEVAEAFGVFAPTSPSVSSTDAIDIAQMIGHLDEEAVPNLSSIAHQMIGSLPPTDWISPLPFIPRLSDINISRGVDLDTMPVLYRDFFSRFTGDTFTQFSDNFDRLITDPALMVGFPSLAYVVWQIALYCENDMLPNQVRTLIDNIEAIDPFEPGGFQEFEILDQLLTCAYSIWAMCSFPGLVTPPIPIAITQDGIPIFRQVLDLPEWGTPPSGLFPATDMGRFHEMQLLSFGQFMAQMYPNNLPDELTLMRVLGGAPVDVQSIWNVLRPFRYRYYLVLVENLAHPNVVNDMVSMYETSAHYLESRDILLEGALRSAQSRSEIITGLGHPEPTIEQLRDWGLSWQPDRETMDRELEFFRDLADMYIQHRVMRHRPNRPLLPNETPMEWLRRGYPTFFDNDDDDNE